MPASISLSLIAFAGIAAAASASGWTTIPDSDAPPQWCGSFNVTGNFTRQGHDPVRISPGIVCGSNTTIPLSNCSLLGGGYWEARATYNSSIALWNERAVDWSIYSSTGDSSLYFSHPAFGGTPNRTYDLVNEPEINGTVAAFIQFTNEYRCVSGVLGDCPAQFALTDGTYIEACTPTYLAGDVAGNGIDVYAGTAALNRTNATYAATLTDNPLSETPAGLVVSAAPSVRSSLRVVLATMGALSAAMFIMA